MSLRAIDVTARSSFVPADQAAPVLEWIAIARLLVDDRYQRMLQPANWRHIEAIAADFRWARFAPVLVAPVENGFYAIIDGQHRTHAAALCGYISVPAMSVHMTLREQASAFNFVNGHVKPIGRHERFKAALASGESWAERCSLLVEKAGCRLMTSNGSSKTKRPGQVYALALIRSLVDNGHGWAITPGLTALRASETGSSQDVFPYTDAALQVWLRTLMQDQQFLTLDLPAFLKQVNLLRVIDKVKVAAATTPTRVPVITQAVAVVSERLRSFAARDRG